MTYRQAKIDMVSLWTPMGARDPVCAICGRPTHNPNAHHLFESRRFTLDEVWNLVPVCNQMEGDCHTVAHTRRRGKLVCANVAYWFWGKGDRDAGREYIMARILGQGYKTRVELPPVANSEEVLEVLARVKAQFK